MKNKMEKEKKYNPEATSDEEWEENIRLRDNFIKPVDPNIELEIKRKVFSPLLNLPRDLIIIIILVVIFYALTHGAIKLSF